MIWQQYSASPPIDWAAPRGSRDDRGIMRYLYECTKPEDRIWELVATFPLPYYAERRAVQHLHWPYGFRNSPEHQRQTLAWLDHQSVPVLYAPESQRPLQWLEQHPLVHEYVSQRYVDASSPKLQENAERQTPPTWVLVDRHRTPTGVYEPLDLPCFR
jgi:hypothetical protein